jgi:hypothetical protein
MADQLVMSSPAVLAARPPLQPLFYCILRISSQQLQRVPAGSKATSSRCIVAVDHMVTSSTTCIY